MSASPDAHDAKTRTQPVLRTALYLLAKDLRLFVRDRVALMLAVLLPIVLVTVFGSIMSGMGGDDEGGGMPTVEVALLDLDDSEASREFVEALGSMDGISLLVMHPDAPREELVSIVNDGERPFSIVLPPGFGEGDDLQLIRDPGRAMSQQLLTIALVRALFETRGEDVLWDLQRRGLEAAGIPPEWAERVESFTKPFRYAMERMFQEAGDQGLLKGSGDSDSAASTGGEAVDQDGAQNVSTAPDFSKIVNAMLPVQFQDVVPSGRQENMTYMIAHAVSGMTVMMLMFSLVGFARTLLEERDDGTLRRLLCAPIAPSTILLGKFLGALVVGIGLTCVLFLHSWVMFDLDVLQYWDSVLVVSIMTAACTSGFALLIASVATSDKQADGLSTILILTMSALGGAWVPLMLMPSAIQTAARFTLPFWSIDAYQRIFWNGLHWTEPGILTNLGVLLGLTVALCAVAHALFRRRYLRAPNS